MGVKVGRCCRVESEVGVEGEVLAVFMCGGCRGVIANYFLSSGRNIPSLAISSVAYIQCRAPIT